MRGSNRSSTSSTATTPVQFLCMAILMVVLVTSLTAPPAMVTNVITINSYLLTLSQLYFSRIAKQKYYNSKRRSIAAGFSVVDRACCGIGQNQGQITCMPLLVPCQNRSHYVFWDAFHPTEVASAILAWRAFSGPPLDSYPINVQQMSLLWDFLFSFLLFWRVSLCFFFLHAISWQMAALCVK